ncbi:MAG: hypothetical protein PHI23_01540 [Candidatus Peribacteraceae bacterium]|nr:hypothetical protein [Candidatus Peribacteraceae bacterium]
MEECFVDKPIDPLAVFFQDTADAYDRYLQHGEWGRNQRVHAKEWAKHYSWMDTAMAGGIIDFSQQQGIQLKDMNIGLIGPGFHPVGHDVSPQTVKVILSKIRRIVVIDFSLQVVRSAIRDLIEGGVSPEKIFGMQFDVTRGLSTMFQQQIAELLKRVETEQQFCDTVEREFLQVEIGTLQQRLGSVLRQLAENPTTMPGDVVGAKSAGELNISVHQGEPVPLHYTAIPMVLTGTNAATEAQIWDRWREVTSEEGRVALPPGSRTERARREVFRQIHVMVAKINSEIAARVVTMVLNNNMTPQNPRPIVCAPTDFATSFNQPPFGMLWRLRQDPFLWRVGELGGLATLQHPSIFSESPSHEHLVASIRVEPAPEVLEGEGESIEPPSPQC